MVLFALRLVSNRCPYARSRTWIYQLPFLMAREAVDLIRKSGVCDREFNFLSSEDGFMCGAAKTTRSNLCAEL